MPHPRANEETRELRRKLHEALKEMQSIREENERLRGALNDIAPSGDFSGLNDMHKDLATMYEERAQHALDGGGDERDE